MNPGEVHACNPVEGEAWSYRMFYVETQWLGKIQADLGNRDNGDFLEIEQVVHRSPALYNGLNALYAVFTSCGTTALSREVAATEIFGGAVETLGQVRRASPRQRPDFHRGRVHPRQLE